MASQEEATVSPRGSPRNQKCGLNPNDPEDVRNFGGLLIDITTTKAKFINLTPNTAYHFRVLNKNVTGSTSCDSLIFKVTTLPTV